MGEYEYRKYALRDKENYYEINIDNAYINDIKDIIEYIILELLKEKLANDQELEDMNIDTSFEPIKVNNKINIKYHLGNINKQIPIYVYNNNVFYIQKPYTVLLYD